MNFFKKIIQEKIDWFHFLFFLLISITLFCLSVFVGYKLGELVFDVKNTLKAVLVFMIISHLPLLYLLFSMVSRFKKGKLSEAKTFLIQIAVVISASITLIVLAVFAKNNNVVPPKNQVETLEEAIEKLPSDFQIKMESFINDSTPKKK